MKKSISDLFRHFLYFFSIHFSKYGPYDYSSYSRLGDAVRHPVAQKKHQMFGKTRYLQDQTGPNM